MKKFLFLLFCLLAILACNGPANEPDSPNVEPDPVSNITVDTDAFTVQAEGGSVQTTVTSTGTWTLSGGETWCSPSKSSGKNGESLSFTVSANDSPDDRNARYTLQCGSASANIVITQKQKNALTVTTSKFEVGAEGDRITVEVKANVDVSYTIDADGENWISLVETKSLHTSNYVFEITPNDEVQKREGSITFSSGDLSERIYIYQEGARPTIVLSRNQFDVAAEGATLQIEVSSNVDVEMELPAEAKWISRNETRAASTQTYYIKVAENPAETSRSAVVAFRNRANDLKEEVTIHQAGRTEALFEINPTSFNVSANGGDISVVVTTNIGYHFTGAPDWITEKNATTEGMTTTHVFTVAPNENTEQRKGVISFCNDNDVCIPVVVTQEAAEEEVTPVFEINPTSFNVDASGGDISVVVTTNIGYHFTGAPDWISEKNATTKGMTTTHVFTVAPNENTEQRKGVISFCNDNDVCIPVVVTQEAAEENNDEPEWKDKEFYHRSLAMRFTATWCGYCPTMAETIKLAQKNMPGKIETVAIHGGGSNLEFAGNETLLSQYDIDGFPTGIIDGRFLLGNYDSSYGAKLIESAVKETENVYSTQTGIAFNSSVSGQNLTVDLTLYLKKADAYKVTVIVTEDNIVGYQADYNNGEHSDYVHNHIARIALTNLSGESFRTTEDASVKNFKYTTAIPSGYNKNNLRILVYVQRPFGSTVIQSGDYGNYFVDNCASAKIGTTLKLMTAEDMAGSSNDRLQPGKDIIM